LVALIVAAYIDRDDGRPPASHANPVCAISNSCPLMDMVD
jgi:hypothetical protein